MAPRTGRWAATATLSCWASLSACGGGSGDGAGVAVGTGCFGDFEAVADGTSVVLEPGNQGLQHVWMTARAAGLPERGLTTVFRVRQAGDGEPSVILGERQSTFTYERFTGVAGGDAVLSGIRVVIDDADAALSGPVVLEVEVADRDADPADLPLARDTVAGVALEEGVVGCD